jgi:cell wall-associated NlpC family hydrolase
VARGDIVVRLIGDSSSLKRGLKESETGLLQFEGATKRAHSTLNSLAVGMLGAGGAVIGLEKMIEAAKHAQESVGHLDVTMKNAGLSYDANRKSIEALIAKQSQLAAFQKSDLRESYGALIRASGDMTTANRDIALTANIARGAHIQLADATNAMVLIEAGRVRGLARLGITLTQVHTAQDALKASGLTFTAEQKRQAVALDKAATTQGAIAELQKKYAGTAAEYGKSSAGAADRFKVSLTNLEITLGTALLPTLTNGLKHVTAWMDELNKSGDMAKYAKDASKTLSGVISDATPIVKGAAAVMKTLADHTGGVKTDVEALVVSGALWKVATGIGAIGTNAEAAGGKVGILRSRLASLSKMAAITIGIDIVMSAHTTKKGLHRYSGSAGWGNLWTDISNSAVHALGGSTGSSGGGKTLAPGPLSSNAVMAAASSFSTTPYQWGGGHAAIPGPSFASGHGRSGLGLDCSGYARAVLAQLGITVNGTADSLLSSAKSHPSQGQLQPGDLVFYEGAHPNHVMVYIGHGQVIGETHTGASGPEIKAVGYMPITGTGRYAGAASDTGGSVNLATAGGIDTTSGSSVDLNTLLGLGKPKNGKVLTGSRLLSAGLQMALATDAGTKTTTDDLRDLKKAETELLAMPQTLNVVKELATVRKGINAIETADTKKAAAERAAAVKAKLKEQEAAYRALTAEVKKELDAQKAAWNLHIKALQAAAAAAKQKLADQWTNAAAGIMAGFDKTTASGLSKMQKDYAAVLTAFDKATQAGLAALASPTQTPAEKALADFIAGRTGAAHDQRSAQLQSDLKTAQDELAGLNGGIGSTVDISTGVTTHTAADDSTRKAAQDKVKAAQDAIDQLSLDDQQNTLQAQADASRKAADDAAKQAQQDYQDQRDALRAHMDDQEQILEDGYSNQRAIERDNLDKWLAYQQAQLDAGKGSWEEFYKELAALAAAYGFDPNGALGDSGAAGAAKHAADAAATAIAAIPYLGINAAVQGGIDPAIALAMAKAKAHIPGFATGVTNFRGGLALVGEHGPEIASLAPGTNITPNGAVLTADVPVVVMLDSEVLFRGMQRASLRNKKRNGSNGL